MHEFSLAQNILDIALGAADEHGLSEIAEVRLDVGEAAGVSLDALLFAWEYLRTTDVRTTEAALDINAIAADGACPHCDYQGAPDGFATLCPECGCGGFKLVTGAEFMVASISAA